MLKVLFPAAFLFLTLPVQAEEGNAADVILLRAEVPADTEFMVYEDAECSAPLLLEGEEVRVKCDEEGILIIPSSLEGNWIREMRPVSGYYASECGTLIENGAKVNMDPIILSLHSSFPYSDGAEEVTYVFAEGNETKEIPWNCAEDAGKYLEAGRTYTVSEKNIPDLYTAAEQQEIEVPLMKPEEDIRIVFPHERLAYAEFHADPEARAEIALFKDEAGNEPVMAEGVPSVLKTGEKIALAKGRYWYRTVSCSESFYEDTRMYPLEVNPEKVTLYKEQIVLHRPKLRIRMNGTSDYRITVKQNGSIAAQWQNDGEEHVIDALRNTAYTIAASPGKDVYGIEDQTVMTGNEGGDPSIVLEPRPFAVHVQIVNQVTGQPEEGTVTVQDQSGQILQELKCSRNGSQVKDLLPDTVYLLQAQESKNTFSSEWHSINADGRQEIHVRLSVQPWVNAALSFGDSASRYTLFLDEACSMPASDREGTVLQDLSGGNYVIRPGSYYLKQTLSAEDEYPDSAVHAVNFSGMQTEESVQISPAKVEAVLQAADAETGKVIPAELQLFEDGKPLMGWKDGGRTVRLKRGRSYLLQLRMPLSGYLSEEKITFAMPQHVPEEPPVFALNLKPYCVLSLQAETEDNRSVPPFAASLYMDKQGMRKAEDIYGKPADLIMNGESPVTVPLACGTYYLFPDEEEADLFHEAGPFRIEVSGKSSLQQVKVSPVALGISFSSENGKGLTGASFELRNEQGDILDEWTTDGGIHYVLHGLRRGQTVVLHQKKAPDGYGRMQTDIVYTLPETLMDEVPVLPVQAEKYNVSQEQRERTPVADTEDLLKEKRRLRLLACAGVPLAVCAVLIVLKKCKKIH